MTGKESPRPEQSGTQRLLLQALAATVLFLALLAGVVAAGCRPVRKLVGFHRLEPGGGGSDSPAGVPGGTEPV